MFWIKCNQAACGEERSKLCTPTIASLKQEEKGIPAETESGDDV